MGKNLQKLFSFRTEEELISKLNFISDYNSRTRNKEIEHVLKNHVKNFEKDYGQLVVGEDGEVTLAKPKIASSSMGSSSNSKKEIG